MAEKVFYCYRCNKHKPIRLLGKHVSPSGKRTCMSCNKDLVKKRVFKIESDKHIDYVLKQVRYL